MQQSKLRLRSKNLYFILKYKIGKGSFGEVYKCLRKKDNQIFAVKSISVNPLDIERIAEYADMMSQLTSDYVLQLVDHFYDYENSSYVLVTPFYKLGSFDQLMTKIKTLDETLMFLYQISKAMEDMTKHRICHFDLKPYNILIEAPGKYVVCDFGCARCVEGANTSFKAMRLSTCIRGGGTTYYGSPELILYGYMSFQNDIWSMGIILYKLIYHRHPFKNVQKNYSSYLQQHEQNKIQIQYDYKYYFEPLISLVKMMLLPACLKKKRINWSEIIDEIYVIILNETRNIYPIIVTHVEQMLYFAYDCQIIVSGLLYYIYKNQSVLSEVYRKRIIKLVCVFMMTISREIVNIFREKHEEFQSFYLFEFTRIQITESQKQLANGLLNQATAFMKEKQVPIEVGNLNLSKAELLQYCNKLMDKAKHMHGENHKSQYWYLSKIKYILEFLYKNKLYFNNRKQLHYKCDYLVDS